MNLKGLDKFRLKVPALAGRRIILLPLYFIGVLSLALFVLTTFFSLPGRLQPQGWNPLLLSFLPLLGFFIVEALGLLLIFQLWAWRDYMKAKYGALSYQRVIPLGFTGVTLMGSLCVSVYLPFYQ